MNYNGRGKGFHVPVGSIWSTVVPGLKVLVTSNEDSTCWVSPVVDSPKGVALALSDDHGFAVIDMFENVEKQSLTKMIVSSSADVAEMSEMIAKYESNGLDDSAIKHFDEFEKIELEDKLIALVNFYSDDDSGLE